VIDNPPVDNPPVVTPKQDQVAPTPVQPVQPSPPLQPHTESVQPTMTDVPKAEPPVPTQPAEVAPPGPVPAAPATPDSAFVARSIAESSPNVGSLQPTGKADLLRIVGKRDDSEVTPTIWTFISSIKRHRAMPASSP